MNISRIAVIPCIIVLIALVFSCSKGGGGSEPPPPPEVIVNLPAKAVGTLPANGSPCTDYTVVANDDTQVLVDFRWNAAQFATSYVLVITESATEVFRNAFTNRETQVQLQRGKTFTWRIISVNEDGQTPGDTYSFTTPGIQIGNYAPYAAAISLDFDNTTGELTVSWIGNDEDGDVLTYDITLVENETTILEELDYTSESISGVPFVSSFTYYARVVSKDGFGNFSVSEKSQKAPE